GVLRHAQVPPRRDRSRGRAKCVCTLPRQLAGSAAAGERTGAGVLAAGDPGPVRRGRVGTRADATLHDRVSALTTDLDAAQRTTFDELGVVRVKGAFDATAAAAMSDVIWRELARRGID